VNGDNDLHVYMLIILLCLLVFRLRNSSLEGPCYCYFNFGRTTKVHSDVVIACNVITGRTVIGRFDNIIYACFR